MTHDEIRTLLSAGETMPAIEQHLETCADCRSWSAALGRIRVAAPTTFSEAPAGLADRVLTAVRAGTTAAVVVTMASDARAATGHSLWKSMGARAAIAAAMAGIIAAGVLTLGGNEPPTLVAAAARTSIAADTARISFTTSLSLRGGKPVELPGLDVNDLRRDITTDMPRSVRGLFGRALETFPNRAGPRSLGAISSHVSGSGVVRFPDRMHVSGTIEERAFGGDGGQFETIVIGGRSYLRVPLFGDAWVAMPAIPFDIRIGYEPGAWLSYLSLYAGSETEVGIERIDGDEVRHYRFTDRIDLGDYLGRRAVRIDLWVGSSDGLIRRFSERHSSDGELGHLRESVDIRLDDYGVAVDIERPANVRTIGELTAGFIGLGFGLAGDALAYSFEAAATVPEIAFPRIRIDFPDFSFRVPDVKIVLPRFDFDIDIDIDIPVPTFSIPPFPQPSFSFGGG